MTDIRVSIAICTWNRAALLADTLSQLTQVARPAGLTWEVVVVNNACTDNTDGVLASFESRLPLRRLSERAPGLAHARNRAVAESRGEYIVWTDDDVLVDAGWLAAYADAFSRWPDADVFGGPIELLFEGDPPPWIHRVLHVIGPVFGRQSYGGQPVALSAARVGDGPYGANFAVRRRALPATPFNVNLGVGHGEYAIGEETDLMRRILGSGRTGWWTPDARAQHRIPRRSQTLEHVRRWMEASGRYEATQRPPHGRAVALWHRARWAGHEAAFRLMRPFANPERWVPHAALASKARGAITVHRQRRLEASN